MAKKRYVKEIADDVIAEIRNCNHERATQEKKQSFEEHIQNHLRHYDRGYIDEFEAVAAILEAFDEFTDLLYYPLYYHVCQ